MKRTILTFLAILAIFNIANAQNKHNITQSQARLIESDFSVVTAPIIGELGEISPTKITDSVEFFIGGFKDARAEIVPNLEDYKRYTIAHYCTKSGFDIIINPLFQISTNAEGDMLKVIVTGFPAKYKSFRQATENDKWMPLYFMGYYKTNDIINNILKNK
ncbi:MAG: hypothetical protein GX638_00945 [Crenarchaeota archaeon]|nr:hypothetical protein [Thermoproteota archaeon]